MHNELRRLTMPEVAATETYKKKFTPVITNHPDLPAINWGAINKSAPVLVDTPANLPTASAVVITWADAEWAALQHVFCSSDVAMTYAKRNTSSWPGWQKYADNLPSGHPSDWDFWGEYRLVQINGKDVLLFKSNTHLDWPGQQYLSKLIGTLIAEVKPDVILSIGTAGGGRVTDHIGTINVVNAGTLYSAHESPGQWSEYANNWAANWTVPNIAGFQSLLFPIPATAADIASVGEQFNKFFNTNYPIATLNVNNLNMGTVPPQLNDLTPQGVSLLTTDTFVVATSAGNFNNYACVEMDDAVIAATCKVEGTAFGFVRNVSDPVQNASLPPKTQGDWGSAIYTLYGLYTSYNGALLTWAILDGQL